MGVKKDLFVDCIGAVTVLTDAMVIFQGQIVRDETERGHEGFEKFPKINIELGLEPEFIVLRLTCDPALLTDEARIEEIRPDLFEEGDIVRINVNEIVAIGPSRECFDSEDPPKKFVINTNG